MTDLSEINETLQRLIDDHLARVSIIVETGYDEAGIVATTDGYLRLASAIIEFILKAQAQQTATLTINGSIMQGSSAIGPLFIYGDEVRINSLMLASSQAEVKKVAEYFRRFSPPWSEPSIVED